MSTNTLLSRYRTPNHYLHAVDMAAVTLTDPGLHRAAQLEINYLLSFDPDRLLVEFRATAGLPVNGLQNYGGWENGPAADRNPDGTDHPTRFTGHFVGHYLSALNEALTATTATADQKAQLAAKLTTLIDGLAAAQQAYAQAHPSAAGFLPAFPVTALPDGADGLLVPFYNLHKLLQGLVDTAATGPTPAVQAQALTIARRFAAFITAWHADHPDVNMLKTEYGGMNAALYELFALTGDDNDAAAAHLFDEVPLFARLADNEDVLPGLHANTTIPKLIGALTRYVVYTENPLYYFRLSNKDQLALDILYRQAAENFWQMVVAHHTYVIGDNSQSEHFHAPDALHQDATANGTEDGGYNDNSTCETCNAHNMLKLTRLLFAITGDAQYSEYYEHTFRNTILASQDPQTGMTTYFQPMQAGYSRVFGVPGTGLNGDDSQGEFWCCQGTGIENFAKLSDSLYFVDGHDVYVNQFFSSVLALPELNVQISQTANVPKQAEMRFAITRLDPAQPLTTTLRLHLRIPRWANRDLISLTTGDYTRTAEDQSDETDWLTTTVNDGPVTLTYTVPPLLQAVASPDDPDWAAFQYGPTVLAGALPAGPAAPGDYAYGGVKVRVAKFSPAAHAASLLVPADGFEPKTWLADLAKNVIRTDAPDDDQPLTFKLAGLSQGSGLVLRPYAETDRAYYAVYWTLTQADSDAYRAIQAQAQAAAADARRTIDRLLLFDNNNAEAGKHYAVSADASVGNFAGHTFRTAGPDGWFSYDLQVDPASAANYLALQWHTADAGRQAVVTVGGAPVGTVTVAAAPADAFYWTYLDLPDDVVALAAPAAAGPQTVTVQLTGNGETPLPRLFGIKTLREKP
ncbi:beta-L-arabinofuranosidase domain-containing protein [Schleiferilactobacillus shenzhenensis]|uniref:Uncharacterized protein n=1 Tax=Schleiferilactobacillus shenzhenensis LY-73 TaxID=1231336 RepID=U4TI91_9LACO|nr:beta-L-arabinofuranosidase domain-containing protein [Schleiferilactobacillus shenzhenensis]ERL63874.1 hypothetical protein L248_1815 [Schleiferilactobacillus shenzhenensis LY-73]